MARPHPGANWRTTATKSAICLTIGTLLNVAVAWSFVWLPPLPMGWMTSWDRVSTAPVDSIAFPPDMPRPNKFFNRMSMGQTQWQMIWDEPGPDGMEATKPARTIVVHLSRAGLPMCSLQAQEAFDVRYPGQITTPLAPNHFATWRSGIDLGPTRYPLFPVWPEFLINTLFFATIVGACLQGFITLRVRRRTRAGLCLTCAYDRRGLSETTPCPECGIDATTNTGAAPHR